MWLRLVFLIAICPSLASAQEPVVTGLGGQAVELRAPDGRAVVLSGLVTRSGNVIALAERHAEWATSLNLNQTDRWGRLIAVDQELNIDLLKRGLAQLQPEQRTPTDAERAAEASAKEARRGLWKERCCDVLDAVKADKVTSQWRVVHGTVTAVSARRELVYVNFGPDWKTDFTLLLKPALARQLKPEDWIGKTIEARGWVQWYYGPAIRITTAAQILLPAAAE
jgi:hypothetical protein